MRLPPPVPIVSGILVLALASPAAAAEDRLARTIALAAGTPVVVDATIADVTVEGTAGSELSVQVVRRAPTEADLNRYPASVEERDGAVHIAAVQADDGRDPALKTEIRLALPRDATLQSIRVFEGRIRVTNLHNACAVALTRGTIDGSGLSGRVRLETELGSIDLRGAELTPGGLMRLRAFNGDVKIRFQKTPASGRILAVTYNGTIASDIPLTMKDRFGPRFGETTLGTPDPVMSIDVVKGNIAIKVG